MQTLYTAEGREVNVPDAAVPISEQKNDFTKWLFSFRQEVVEPLRHIWNNEQFLNGSWEKTTNTDLKPLMNEKGIMWCISYIDSYLNAATVVTDLDYNDVCFRMRRAIRDIWNGLCYQYKVFELDKVNIARMANEMESKIHFIIKGAMNNGYRTFFTKTYSVQEIKQELINQQPRGMFGMFGGQKQQQAQGMF